MKTTQCHLGFILLLAGFGFASASQAALSARPGGLVYDSSLNITWLQDANYAATQYVESAGAQGADGGLVDAAAANDWASSLVFAGVGGWRLPSADPACPSQYDCVTSELGHLFYGDLSYGLGGTADTPITDSHNANFDLFTNIQASGYWTGTALAADPNFVWNFDTFDGTQLAYAKDVRFLAWAVHAGDVVPVPLPGAAWLLASAGGFGWVGLRLVGRRTPQRPAN
ncbi:MAG: hypothetical protein ACKN9T_00125 [Candidatus Methylumidiphilus sp.]